MPTLKAILDAEATLREARTTADQLKAGDRIVHHFAPPGEIFCTRSVPATVVSAHCSTPGRIHPTPEWEVTILPDTLVNGRDGTRTSKCSAKFWVLRATGRATVEDLAAGLVAKGYRAAVAGLGGNVVGVEVTTLHGYRWVISADDLWYIGKDDERENGVAAAAELDTDLELLVAWADQIMGCDR